MAEWYIIHVAAGSENKVAVELEAQFEKNNLADSLENVLVPKKMVLATRRGVKIQVEDRILPGYVLVQMDCTLDALHIIRRVPRVIGMLGADAKGMPRPLSEFEVSQLLDQIENVEQATRQSFVFEPGEMVKVSEGLFTSMEGVVEEVDSNRMRLKVSISIFGRPTLVDLEFSQVEKI
jgi:transcriptional antiterminator NusG